MPTKQIGARVHHVGHGNGTIIAYNQLKPANPKILEHVQELNNSGGDILAPLLVAGGIAALYDGARYPYVVKFDTGHTDVYTDNDLELLPIHSAE
jgi:hypothetical protein